MNIYLISLLLENTVLGCEQILKRGCFEAIVKVFFFFLFSFKYFSNTDLVLREAVCEGLRSLGLKTGWL